MPTKEDEIFGKIAIANNFITEEQWKSAVETLKEEEAMGETSRSVGDVLLEKEIIGRDDAIAITEAYRRRLNLGEFAAASITEMAGKIDDTFFSKVAMLNKVVTREQLSECSKLQANFRREGKVKKIAEITHEKGYLADQYILSIFALQQEHKRTGEEIGITAQAYSHEQDYSFCRIALFNKVITEFQLDEVMAQQKEMHDKGEECTLTQLLIGKGYVTGNVVKILMEEVDRYLS